MGLGGGGAGGGGAHRFVHKTGFPNYNVFEIDASFKKYPT